jgi:hypothetical protein
LYARALLIKLIIALTVTGILIYMTGTSLLWGTTIALILTLVTSLATDLPFLPLLGRKVTVLVDAAVAIPLVWSITRFIIGVSLPVSSLVILALVIMAGEWFSHVYAFKAGFYKDLRVRVKD